MQIEWPTHLWQSPHSDADTEEYRRARDKAVGDVYAHGQRRPIVAVSGSGRSHEYKTEAYELGKRLAEVGVTLTTGGLDGIMFDVTDGYVHTGNSVFDFIRVKPSGKAIGIVPKGKEAKAKELSKRLPGAIRIHTDLPGTASCGARHTGPSSRNHVLIFTADIVICMPGDEGSIAEAGLAMEVYNKPTIAYAPPHGAETKWHKAIERLRIPIVHEIKDVKSWLGDHIRHDG